MESGNEDGDRLRFDNDLGRGRSYDPYNSDEDNFEFVSVDRTASYYRFDFYRDFACTEIGPEKKRVPDWERFESVVITNWNNLSKQQQQSALWLLCIYDYAVAQSLPTTEDHHLVPRSLNGHHTDVLNRLLLDAPVHFTAHVHLAILFPDMVRYKQV